jgi:hypothetical protein
MKKVVTIIGILTHGYHITNISGFHHAVRNVDTDVSAALNDHLMQNVHTTVQ